MWVKDVAENTLSLRHSEEGWISALVKKNSTESGEKQSEGRYRNGKIFTTDYLNS